MNARGYMMSMLYCFDIPVIAVMAFRCYNFQNKAECIFMANSHRDFFLFLQQYSLLSISMKR